MPFQEGPRCWAIRRKAGARMSYIRDLAQVLRRTAPAPPKRMGLLAAWRDNVDTLEDNNEPMIQHHRRNPAPAPHHDRHILDGLRRSPSRSIDCRRDKKRPECIADSDRRCLPVAPGRRGDPRRVSRRRNGRWSRGVAEHAGRCGDTPRAIARVRARHGSRACATAAGQRRRRVVPASVRPRRRRKACCLMCVAEALLCAFPTPKPPISLIRDKLSRGDWERHLGASDSLLVNASTWGLMLTGQPDAHRRSDHARDPTMRGTSASSRAPASPSSASRCGRR